ncbi:MAG: hypothetical protein ACLFTK_16835, partial [Anaerolineales bacterium]
MPYYRFWLGVILIIAVVTGWMVWPDNPGLNIDFLDIEREIEVQQGLDLQGGSRVLLRAAALQEDVSQEELNTTRRIVENRVNGLGVTEAVVQT